MTKCLIDFFKRQDVEYILGFNISKLSSIGIGGIADFAAIPSSEEKLIKTIDFLRKSKIKYRVVGRMTNILATGERYDGVLVLTFKINRYTVAENSVSIQCGARLSTVLKELSLSDIGICDELYGIPGSVGGMVIGNAGAFGKCVADALISAKVYLPSEEMTVISADSCVRGCVTSHDLRCAGTIVGDITVSGHITLECTAHISGNIITNSISVAKGAAICGGVEIKSGE